MTAEQIHQVAAHEAGHAIVANRFGVSSVPEIFLDGRTFPGTSLVQAGECQLENNHTPYQGVAIAWGGLLAECLLGEKIPSFAPPFRPSARDLESWHSAMFCRMKNFSPGDRALIMRGYKQSLKACRAAFKIIRKNTAALKRLAGHLADHARKQQAESYSLTIEKMNPTIPKLAEPEPVNENFQLPETPLELPNRVQMLKNFLARVSADDPQKQRFEQMLAHLERGLPLQDENK